MNLTHGATDHVVLRLLLAAALGLSACGGRTGLLDLPYAAPDGGADASAPVRDASVEDHEAQSDAVAPPADARTPEPAILFGGHTDERGGYLGARAPNMLAPTRRIPVRHIERTPLAATMTSTTRRIHTAPRARFLALVGFLSCTSAASSRGTDGDASVGAGFGQDGGAIARVEGGGSPPSDGANGSMPTDGDAMGTLDRGQPLDGSPTPWTRRLQASSPWKAGDPSLGQWIVANTEASKTPSYGPTLAPPPSSTLAVTVT